MSTSWLLPAVHRTRRNASFSLAAFLMSMTYPLVISHTSATTVPGHRERGQGRLARVLEARRHPVHGEEQKALGARAARTLAQGAQRPQLQRRKRVDVRVSKLDRPGQHAPVLEQPPVLRHGQDRGKGAV